MSANTTRLNLYKPGGGSTGLILPDEIADIDKINGNMDLIDAAIGARIVTSTTRPATPFNGQIIYETDTKNTLVYNLALTTWVFAIASAPVPVSTASQLPLTAVTGDLKTALDTGITWRWGGAAWKQWESDWTSYTTTWAGTTEGNSTTTFFWRYLGGDVDFEMRRVSGSTGVITATNSFSLPVVMNARVTTAEVIAVGSVLISGTVYPVSAYQIAAGTLRMGAPNAAGTYVALAAVTNSVPAALATGAEIFVLKGKYSI